jgi:hypothetical protein
MKNEIDQHCMVASELFSDFIGRNACSNNIEKLSRSNKPWVVGLVVLTVNY